MDELNEVRQLILKARRKQVELDTLIDKIYNLLNDMNVNIRGLSEAENAVYLDGAINCYIEYNEYNIDSIMKEIKENMK